MLLFSRFLSVSSLLHQTGPGLSCLRQKSLWHLSCSCVPGVVFGGGRRGKVRGGKSDAESRPPAPLRLAELISPSNHSWMFSMRSPQGGGWVPETQTELTEFHKKQVWGWSTLRCCHLTSAVLCRESPGGRAKAEKT